MVRSGRTAVIVAMAASLIVPVAGRASAADGDPLVVTSTGLTDGQLIGSRQVIHPTWAGADVVKVELYVDGRLVHTYLTWANGLAVPVSRAEDDTDIDVSVRVYDAAGDSAQATTRVHVDDTAPHATFTPAFGSLVRGVVTVTAAELSSDVAEIDLYDATTKQPVASATAAPWTLTWDTLTQSPHVRLAVKDRAGNVTDYGPGYHVDNIGPTISDLTYFRGIVPGQVRGLTQINVDLPDTSGTSRTEWWVDGALASTDQTSSSNSWYSGSLLTYDFGTTQRTSTIDVRAWDRAGNESTRTFDVTVDGTGPTITAITPANGTLIRGNTITSTAVATDPSDILDALFDGYYFDNTPHPANTHLTLAVPAGADGRRTLTWRIDDYVGNTSTATQVVIVDNTPPKLAMTKAPKNGAKVSGTVKITLATTDRNGINRVELFVNGRRTAVDTKPGYAFTINTKKYAKKLHIAIRASDNAGNTTTINRAWHR